MKPRVIRGRHLWGVLHEHSDGSRVTTFVTGGWPAALALALRQAALRAPSEPPRTVLSNSLLDCYVVDLAEVYAAMDRHVGTAN